MRVTIDFVPEEEDAPEQDLLSLEVAPATALSILKEMVQAEVGIPSTSQHLYYNGNLLLDDTKSLEQLNIGDGDIMSLHIRSLARSGHAEGATRPEHASMRPPHAQAATGEQDPELMRLQLLGDPRAQEVLRSRQPELAAAIDNPLRFGQLYRQLIDRDRQERIQRSQQIAQLNADPFDIEAQMRIEEMIRQEAVQENLQSAIEHNPEVFGRVHMLYIDVEVNGHKVKAFVDSGAQATIMSPSCAEACGIMRLIDKRFSGVARGVGTANILGRVHSAQIKIGSLFLPCSFTVMEGKDVDLLLGLDMLKRHQACIDLAKDKLIIQGVEVPFLGEADIPRGMEEARMEEPTVAGPGGTTIGTRSGAISGPADSQSSPAPTTIQEPSNPVAGPSGQANPAQPPVSQQAVDQLVALGFTPIEATRALEACDGNVDLAANLLFQS